jgi:hypothetical protein
MGRGDASKPARLRSAKSGHSLVAKIGEMNVSSNPDSRRSQEYGNLPQFGRLSEGSRAAFQPAAPSLWTQSGISPGTAMDPQDG